MLVTIARAAKRDLLIEDGKHVDALVKAEVPLVGKSETLTLGQPQNVSREHRRTLPVWILLRVV